MILFSDSTVSFNDFNVSTSSESKLEAFDKRAQNIGLLYDFLPSSKDSSDFSIGFDDNKTRCQLEMTDLKEAQNAGSFLFFPKACDKFQRKENKRGKLRFEFGSNLKSACLASWETIQGEQR